MSVVRFDNFVGASYLSQATTADQEELYNWYPERPEVPGSTSPQVLNPTPGVNVLTTATSGTGRAHIYINGREFMVIGTRFKECDAGGALTDRGEVAYDSNPATISANGDTGDELFITSGGNGYNFNLSTNTLTQIAALNGIATMGAFLDGYFLCLDATTSTFRASDLLDGLTWSGIMVAHRNLAPDRWVALKVLGRYIWLLGEQTSEIWYNQGSSPFPFAVYATGLVQYGCVAPFSATVAGKSLCWVNQDKDGVGQVVSASGFTPERISTFPLENAISGYALLSDAIGDCYSDQGHSFYLLTFQAQDVTWCYDQTTGLWHKRGTWISEAPSHYSAWSPRFHAYAFGQHRMLDSASSNVYTMSASVSTDVNGRPIRRMRRAPSLMKSNERVTYSAFELVGDVGLGLATGQGSDPQVMLRMSNDGGKTWGPELWRSAGKVGEFGRRIRWNRCGQARKRVFEVAVSDPIPWRLTDAFIDVDGEQPEQRAA